MEGTMSGAESVAQEEVGSSLPTLWPVVLRSPGLSGDDDGERCRE